MDHIVYKKTLYSENVAIFHTTGLQLLFTAITSNIQAKFRPSSSVINSSSSVAASEQSWWDYTILRLQVLDPADFNSDKCDKYLPD